LTLTELLAPIQDDMARVDGVIRSRLASTVPLIQTVGDYIIAGGGKRMRPALLLMTAAALGGRGGNVHLLAAVVEFIHTATLLHDDVVDESGLRRGRQTANAVFGNATSVLVGDFLYSRAFQMMVEPGDARIMQILADATNVIAEGEVLQLLNVGDTSVTEERYLQVVRYKTARLFEAAAELGAVVAGADAARCAEAAAYGRHIGTAFQLVDDVLDYDGNAEELGKNLGDDLREGKPTLPLLRVLQVGSDQQQALVRSVIEQGGGDLDAVVAAIRATDALDYTRERARQEAVLALEAIAAWPASSYQQSLLNFCSFALNRRA
jgi:octaprenyl-diphosphate synthase